VASAHIIALEKREANGRYFCGTTPVPLVRIMQIIHENFADLNVPSKRAPDAVLSMMSGTSHHILMPLCNICRCAIYMSLCNICMSLCNIYVVVQYICRCAIYMSLCNIYVVVRFSYIVCSHTRIASHHPFISLRLRIGSFYLILFYSRIQAAFPSLCVMYLCYRCRGPHTSLGAAGRSWACTSAAASRPSWTPAGNSGRRTGGRRIKRNVYVCVSC
jgi:hypothetical protein